MTSARLSPTANLLRKSRVFALPQALKPPQEPPTSKTVFESDSATLPYPTRASIVTPGSSSKRGDWGLKRPIPSKSTSEKSVRPVIRVNAHDTFEHVTDFESAQDHTLTLAKFQELHLPMSLPSKVNYSSSFLPGHQSPFELDVDNTQTSKDLARPYAKQFRQSGPWLAGQTEAEFQTYLKKVRRDKPEVLQRLRDMYVAKRTVEQRKAIQDKGEDLENMQPIKFDEKEFHAYIKSLRADPTALGPVIFELLDLPSPPPVPNMRIAGKYFHAPGTKLSATEYATSGPPRTHPSAGLSYTRSHALLYNHPEHGPQAYQRPVQARILRPKSKLKGKGNRAIAGIGGIASEDVNSITFWDQRTPPGLAYFDASIEGGGKYWATPIRASVTSDGRIDLASLKASVTAKAPYGIEDAPEADAANRVAEVTQGASRQVPKLDARAPRFRQFDERRHTPMTSREDAARSLMETLKYES